jgi:hypothetical protein
MRRVPFSRLLFLIALVPVIAFALFAARLTYESFIRYNDLANANSLLRLAVATGRFGLQGMPGEAGPSRDFLLGGDRAKVDAGRANADRTYREFQEAVAANIVADRAIEGHVKTIGELMQRFQNFRGRIDAKTAQSAEITASSPTERSFSAASFRARCRQGSCRRRNCSCSPRG